MTKGVLYGILFGVISLHGQQLLSDRMIGGKTLKGAPFSAEALDESVRVLEGGNRITESSLVRIYRDSEGRERRESLIGADRVPKSILIYDPTEGTKITLRPEEKVAIKTFEPKLMPEPRQSVPFSTPLSKADLDSIVKRPVETVMMNSSQGWNANLIGFVRTPRETTGESLGTQMMLGISTEGTRRTATIRAGAIGNERPIVSVIERWFSPDLQVLVMSTRSDPQSGTTMYRLTNIDRGEPAPTLFQVPTDYALKDLTRTAQR